MQFPTSSKADYRIMRIFVISLLFIMSCCAGVNSSDSDDEPKLRVNEKGAVVLHIPEILQIDSTYSFSIEAMDSDELQSISIKEQLNDNPPDSVNILLSASKFDTTLTRSFGQTGDYTISVTATDAHLSSETFTESIPAEIVENVEQRRLTLSLSGSGSDANPDSISVLVYNTKNRLIAEGEIEDGIFEFDIPSAEGRTETAQIEFSGHGYSDFSEEIDHTSSGEYNFSIAPAPIDISTRFPELSPGEAITVDTREFISSSDPDDNKPISIERLEFSETDEHLQIDHHSEFTYQFLADKDVSEEVLTAQLTVYTETNSETETVEFPLEGANTIIQMEETIPGEQGEDTDIQLSDYFSSPSPFTVVQFNSSDVTVDDLGNGTYRFSQADDVTGSHTIEVWLENETGQTREAELTYQINGNSDSQHLVIMPLGNSLTNDGRSRVTLWHLLEADSHTVDYVGDQHQQGPIPDPDHEGVGGIEIQGIIDKAERLMNEHNPEYVNLMVGTNDIVWYTDEDMADVAERWNDLVQILLDSSGPETYIVAATIPPVTSEPVGRDDRDRAVLVAEYNEALRNYVEARQNAGHQIVLADAEAEMNVNEHVSSDGVHLNDEGYEVMGTVYYEAINSILQENE